MHELSISSAIVDTAVAHAGGRKVSLVTVKLGHLRQAIPSSLEFYFEICARDTLAEGARLELEIVPGRLRCRACACEWGTETIAFRCPRCEGSDVTVMSGEELQVESIEVEDAACIA